MGNVLVIRALGLPFGWWSLAYERNNIFGVNGSRDPIAIINTPSV